MPRLLLAATLAVLFACSACNRPAPEPVEEARPEKPILTVGMPAPPLKVDRWLQGDPVPAFEPGKVYVVEFWATWCGPCIAAMPHLSELATKLRPQGLQVIALSTVDEQGNTPEAVAQFVAERGQNFNFTFALSLTEATKAAYMDAADVHGLPASFVVDQTGKIAFIGHPSDLDNVLPKVLAGTWRGEADVRAMREQEIELDAILGKLEVAAKIAQRGVDRTVDRATAIAAINKAIAKAANEVVEDLARFAEKYPERAATPTFQLDKAQVLLAAGRTDEARTVTVPVLTTAVEQRNVNLLRVVVELWTNPGLNPQRRYTELPLRAASEWLTIEGERNLAAVWAATQAYFFAGEKEKGRSYGAKAIDLATDPRQRAQLEQALQSLEK